MNNEDYARQLCCSGCNNYVCYTNKERCQTLEDLLTIAQWKDEQFEKTLADTYDWRREMCRSDTSFADCTELIKQLRLKLKGE